MVKYPAQIDNSLSLPTVIDNFSPVTGDTVNRLRDAILSIETELGVKPSGLSTTVRNRLDDLQSKIDGSILPGTVYAANLAALSAIATIDMTNGQTAYVNTIKSYFQLDSSNTFTIDGITIVNAADGGRWLRMKEEVHPAWQLQNTWKINALTGNDENDGYTISNALKTHNELWRRLGTNAKINQITTVEILSDLPGSDIADIIISVGPSGSIQYYASGTTILSGAFSGMTPRNRLTNQRTLCADTSITNWDGYENKHIRITGGPRIGTTAWVWKSLGGTAYLTEPVLAGTYGSTEITLSIGDPYVIENLFKIYIGRVVIKSDTYDFTAVSNNLFSNINIGAFGLYGGSLTIYCDLQFTFKNCLFDAIPVHQDAGWVSFYEGCLLKKGINCTRGWAIVDAGGVKQGVFVGDSGVIYLDTDVLVTGSGLMLIFGSGRASLGVVGFFDCIVGNNPLGSGIYAINGTIDADSANTGSRMVWGSGNAGYGVHLGPNVKALVAISIGPTVTGAMGDFTLAGRTQSRAWDEALGSYTNLRNNTWTLLKTTIPSGGFKHPTDTVTNAHAMDVNTVLLGF